MADTNTDISLETLHTAIRDQIAAHFPDLATVAFYQDDEDHQLPMPACLLTLSEIEPAPKTMQAPDNSPPCCAFRHGLS